MKTIEIVFSFWEENDPLNYLWVHDHRGTFQQFTNDDDDAAAFYIT
jgi:hypothetical protein